MKKSDKIKDKLQSLTLSLDAFCVAYTSMLVFFFVPYCASVCGSLVIAFLPIVFIIPFAVMPLVYTIVHRFNPLLFGRYHLFMPLSAMIGTLFFVLSFSADGGGGQAALVFFGLLVFVCSLIVYRYCSFSVAARLGGKSIARLRAEEVVFALIGAALSFVSIYCFYTYDPQTMFINSAYLAGGLCVIAALVQYLRTVNETPRLALKRNRSVKSVFRSFYVGLDTRLFMSSVFFISAFVGISGLIVYYVFALGLATYLAVAMAGVIAGSYAIGYVAAHKFINKRTVALSIVIAVMLVLSAVLIAMAVAFNDVGKLCCISPAAVLAGVGGALCARQAGMRFLSVKPHATSGTVYMLMKLARCAGIAIALVPIATVCLVYEYLGGAACLSYGFVALAILPIVGFVLTYNTTAEIGKLPELSYELNMEELRSTSGGAVEGVDRLIIGKNDEVDAEIDELVNGNAADDADNA